MFLRYYLVNDINNYCHVNIVWSTFILFCQSYPETQINYFILIGCIFGTNEFIQWILYTVDGYQN